MTELQQIEFDMFKVFVDICNKLNIKYFLVCGSCLGAVKYGGFIPWDDDLDVALVREDYEIFCKKALDYLPNHIILQNYQTNSSVSYLFSKLRNIKTTFIEKSVAQIPIEHGIYIDIFPLDGYPVFKRKIKKLERKKRVITSLISCVYAGSITSLKGKFNYKIKRMLGFHKNTYVLVDTLTKELSSYQTNNSNLWCNHGNWQGKLEYALKEQYGNGTWVTFEGLKVRIPEKYDEYLTQKYGDWRADLSEDQKVGHHYAEVIDLTRPYTDYIEKLPRGRIRIKSKEEVESDYKK